MKENFFKKAEELTIKTVRNYFTNEQSKILLENVLLKIWQIHEGELQYVESGKKIKNVIEMLQSLKTLIDKNYPEYGKGHELNWGMTIFKFALPRMYLQLKKTIKEKNIANFPLYITKKDDNTALDTEVVHLYHLKQTISELTFKVFEEIAGVAFFDDKTNNPFVEEIAEKLNNEIKTISKRETIRKLSEIK